MRIVAEIQSIDPDGRKFDLSDLTEEQQKSYPASVDVQKKDNALFITMYNQLASSYRAYKVNIGETVTENGPQVDAQFAENKDGIESRDEAKKEGNVSPNGASMPD